MLVYFDIYWMFLYLSVPNRHHQNNFSLGIPAPHRMLATTLNFR